MKYQFKPGDRVRVKDWDELVSKWPMQYKDITSMEGLNVNGLYFNPNMRKYCSHIFTVDSIYGYYRLRDDNGNILTCNSENDSNNFPWSFNDDMLDPAPDIYAIQIEPTVSFSELFTMGD